MFREIFSKFWAFNKHYKTGNRVEEDFAKSVGIEIIPKLDMVMNRHIPDKQTD